MNYTMPLKEHITVKLNSQQKNQFKISKSLLKSTTATQIRNYITLKQRIEITHNRNPNNKNIKSLLAKLNKTIKKIDTHFPIDRFIKQHQRKQSKIVNKNEISTYKTEDVKNFVKQINKHIDKLNKIRKQASATIKTDILMIFQVIIPTSHQKNTDINSNQEELNFTFKSKDINFITNNNSNNNNCDHSGIFTYIIHKDNKNTNVKYNNFFRYLPVRNTENISFSFYKNNNYNNNYSNYDYLDFC